MIYGYCSINTRKQSMERQIKNMKESFPDAVIVSEDNTESLSAYSEWKKLFSKLGKKDVIIFDSVSRMSRNAAEAFSLYKELVYRNIKIIFLRERHIDTEAYREALNGVIPLSFLSEEQTANKPSKDVMLAIDHFIMNKIEQDIYKAFEQSEKTIMYMSRRTREGIEAARSNGKQIGTVKGSVHETKKSKAVKPLIIRYCKDFEGTLSDKECMKLIGLSNNTYYKYKRELRNQK